MKIFIAIFFALQVNNFDGVEGRASEANPLCPACAVKMTSFAFEVLNGIWTSFWNNGTKAWIKDDMYLVTNASENYKWYINTNLADPTAKETLLAESTSGTGRGCPQFVTGWNADVLWNQYPETGGVMASRPFGKCAESAGVTCPPCKTVTGAGSLDGKYNLQNSTAPECGDGCLYLGPDNKKYCFDNNGAGDIGACPE